MPAKRWAYIPGKRTTFCVALLFFVQLAFGQKDLQNYGAAGGSAQGVAPLGFEVATIRPARADAGTSNVRIARHRVYLESEPLPSLIALGFGIHEQSIISVPRNLASTRFDIEGVYALDHDPTLQDLQQNVRSLLVDRFGLKSHWEEKELPIYSLTVIRSGARLAPSKSGANSMPSQTGGGSSLGALTRRFTNNSMDDLALGLEAFLDRPVVNHTELQGRYDFALSWAPDLSPDTANVPPLATALKDQLGLQMQPTRGLTRVLVVDALTGPTPN